MQKLLELQEKLLSQQTGASANSAFRHIDDNIVCYVTGSNYTEDILGYGLSAIQQGRQINFSTPAELISKSAFDSGIRQSSNKQEFKYFLPAFINKSHAAQSGKWKNALRSSLLAICTGVYGYSDTYLAKAAYELFTRLINTLVLEMMKEEDEPKQLRDEDYDSDEDFDAFLQRHEQLEMAKARMSKSPSIAYFEAICSFWRTFYWLSESNLLPAIKNQGCKMVHEFTTMVDKRLKAVCPDVGAMLASFSIFQSSCKVNSNQEFIDAYLDECFVRCVKWWQASLRPPNSIYRSATTSNPTEVFSATKVSRDITLFQLMFLRHVIGNDVSRIAEVMDVTNGKAPEVLANFQRVWREVQASMTTWKSFFGATGCSNDFKQRVLANEREWVQTCVKRAGQRGRSYL